MEKKKKIKKSKFEKDISHLKTTYQKIYSANPELLFHTQKKEEDVTFEFTVLIMKLREEGKAPFKGRNHKDMEKIRNLWEIEGAALRTEIKAEYEALEEGENLTYHLEELGKVRKEIKTENERQQKILAAKKKESPIIQISSLRDLQKSEK